MSTEVVGSVDVLVDVVPVLVDLPEQRRLRRGAVLVPETAAGTIARTAPRLTYARRTSASAPVRRRRLSVEQLPGVLSVLILVLFVAVQAGIIAMQLRGPFTDEGMYVTAGLRTIGGKAIDDGFMSWIQGSLIWPVMSAIGFLAGDLVGIRLVALACVAVAIAGSIRTTHVLFGGWAAVLAALFLVVNGPTFHLAQLAVYDVLALAGVGIALWGVAELYRSDSRRWLMVVVVGITMTALAKYPTVVCALPVSLLIVALRGRKAMIDLGLFAFGVAAMLLIYFLPFRDQVSQVFAFRSENNPAFGFSRLLVAYSQAYFGLAPFLLALLGCLVARRRLVAAALFTAMLIPPIYHIGTANQVSDLKHVVFAAMFGYPLIGMMMARFATHPVGRVAAVLSFAGMAMLGAVQFARLNASWPDTRPAIAYLRDRVSPGERILANNMLPYTASLYRDGVIGSPWDVFDAYRLQDRSATGPICEMDWLVDEGHYFQWPAGFMDDLNACGEWVVVFSSTSRVENLGLDFNYVAYDVTTTVWRNMARLSRDDGYQRDEVIE